VLVLEDLHWSDYATLDLLALLARRRAPARLLVLGTYRPVDVIVSGHPLRTVLHDLQQHGHSQALLLEPLTAGEVDAYLHGRFVQHQFPATLVRALYQWTEGHPLFMRTVVEALVRQGTVVQIGEAWAMPSEGAAVALDVPDSLRHLLEQQFEQLSATEQQVLEAASVAGSEGTVAAMAAALDTAESTVEDVCAMLARRGQFLALSGEVHWPDGTQTACYRFLHSLYYDVIYHRIPLSRRQRLHQRMGVREEGGMAPGLASTRPCWRDILLVGGMCAAPCTICGRRATTPSHGRRTPKLSPTMNTPSLLWNNSPRAVTGRNRPSISASTYAMCSGLWESSGGSSSPYRKPKDSLRPWETPTGWGGSRSISSPILRRYVTRTAPSRPGSAP
jgi:hypothetical protein